MPIFNKQSPKGQEVLKSLAWLRNNGQYNIYVEFLQDTLNSCRKRNDHLTGDSLKWSQGKCQMLQEILEHPDVAKKILENN